MGVAPSTLIPTIEGMVSTMPTNAPQSVAEWIKDVKSLLRLTSLRDQSDWAFSAINDVDETADVIRSGASTVYALLIANVNADSETNFFCLSNATSNTFAGESLLDDDDVFAFQIPAAATSGTEEFHGFIFPAGILCGTGICLGADGRAGTSPGADEVRAWVLYREA